MDDNTVTVGELKRRGMAALEKALERGPVHIVKRNRRAAVILAEGDYERLLASAGKAAPGMTALEWLLAHPAEPGLGKNELDARLQREREW